LAGVFLGFLPACFFGATRLARLRSLLRYLPISCRVDYVTASPTCFEIISSAVTSGDFIFRDIGDDLATCMAHGPQERSHETVESAQQIADPMPSL